MRIGLRLSLRIPDGRTVEVFRGNFNQNHTLCLKKQTLKLPIF